MYSLLQSERFFSTNQTENTPFIPVTQRHIHIKIQDLLHFANKELKSAAFDGMNIINLQGKMTLEGATNL